MTAVHYEATAGARRTHIIEWETVAVTALPPGWRNIYEDDGALIDSPCPAILLQENRGTITAWDEPQGDGRPPRRRTSFDAAEPPYETRAVFADWDAGGGAEMIPADEASNYAGTVAPGGALPRREAAAPGGDPS